VGQAEVDLWLGDLVRANLDFSLALWKLRNGMVHRITWEESRQKQLENLRKQVTEAYRAYKNDPFLVLWAQCYLFVSWYLHQRLQQDTDTLLCWLSDVDDAKRSQQESRLRAAAAAKTFFQPKCSSQSKIPVEQLSKSSRSSGNTTRTYVSADWSVDDGSSLSTRTYDEESWTSETFEARCKRPGGR
jgi:hypothetical protein